MKQLPNLAVNTKKYRFALFILCFVSGVFGGITSTLVPSYLPEIVKSLAADNLDKISALINASFIYGMLTGGIVLGYWSDRAGRKTGLQISTFCIGLFTLLTAFAYSWTWLVALRFMTGIGVGGVLLVATVIVAEVWPSSQKGIALGILSICFPVGIFSAGLITYNIPDWHQAFLTGAVPLLLVVIGHFLVRETTDWQQEKIKATNSKNPSAAKAILPDLVLGSLIYGTMLIGLWAVFAWLPTWVQGIVKGSDGQRERGISMMLFAAGGLLGGVASGWLAKQFGTKKMMLLCFMGSFALSVVLFRFTFSLSLLTYGCMAVIALFFGISQGVLNIYIPGLFPTVFRSTATGFCFNIGRVFTATVVFFVGWMVEALHGFANALFSFSFIFLIGFIITLLSKEKKSIPT